MRLCIARGGFAATIAKGIGSLFVRELAAGRHQVIAVKRAGETELAWPSKPS